MSFPRYPAYKPSGVEWLGEVPEHWNRTALKFLADYQNGYPFKPEDRGQEGLPIIRISQLTGDDEPAYYSGNLDERVKVRYGDLLFTWSATIDSFIWDKGEAWLNQHIFRVSPSAEADKRYMYYVIKHVAPKLADFDAHGSTMRHIKKESLGEKVYVPSVRDQGLIATFLDHETAKIDALIAEQQRLIELLQEKRQAVISHAVTKGLNPDAPMKDSGVEWLGEVPEHWDARKISQLFVGIGSGTTPKSDEIEYYEDGDIPWVVTGDLNDELLESCSNFITRKAMQAHTTLRLYPKGSVAVAMYGATIGKAALFGLEATVNQACCVLPPSVKVNENLLLHFIISARNHLISLATGGGQPNINQDIVRSLRIPIPEVDEQIEIVEHLSKILVELEGLLRLSDRQVRLLQERRSALISAAVTGQIDVRGLVPEAAAA